MREVRYGIFPTDALQVIHPQRGDVKRDIGEFDVIGERPQSVVAGAQGVPIEGVAKAIIVVAADLAGVLAGGAVGDPLPFAAVDLYLHRVGPANPSPNQPDPTFERALVRTFQMRSIRRSATARCV